MCRYVIGFEPNLPDFLLAQAHTIQLFAHAADAPLTFAFFTSQFNAMNNYENIRIYNAFVGEEARHADAHPFFRLVNYVAQE